MDHFDNVMLFQFPHSNKKISLSLRFITPNLVNMQRVPYFYEFATNSYETLHIY